MTFEETLEFVSRALAREDGEHKFSRAQVRDNHPAFTSYIDNVWGRYTDKALIAIKAHLECLMEPSEERLVAGGVEMVKATGRQQNWREDASLVFQAMLSVEEKTDD